MLDDKSIRKALISFLTRKRPQPKLIVEELGMHNGNAIADVVAIYDSLHGYEIKGESDSVSRVIRQSQFYNLSFPKLTLVTTQNHFDWAQKNLPEFWGIMLAKNEAGIVSITYKRRARSNPLFSKEASLLMLWKSELLSPRLMSQYNSIRQRDTRVELASKLASKLNKKEILNLLQDSILDRKISALKASQL